MKKFHLKPFKKEGIELIKKYRKKPIVIEAIEITGPEVFPEIEKWMNCWVLKYPTEKVKVRESSKGEYNCYLNSSCIFRNSFRIGDFFVKGVDDSIYPVSKESFWKVYDEVGSKELTWRKKEKPSKKEGFFLV